MRFQRLTGGAPPSGWHEAEDAGKVERVDGVLVAYTSQCGVFVGYNRNYWWVFPGEGEAEEPEASYIAEKFGATMKRLSKQGRL